MRQRAHIVKAVGFVILLICAPALLAAEILNPLLTSEPSTKGPTQSITDPNTAKIVASPLRNEPREDIVYAETHDSWSAVCVVTETLKRTCFAETKVTKRTDPDKAVVRLRLMPSGDSPTGLSMELSVPVGTLLPSHAQLKVGEVIFNAPYTICDKDYCIARVSVSSPLLGTLLGASGGFVTFITPPSEEVTIPLMFKGLSSAILDMNSQLGENEG